MNQRLNRTKMGLALLLALSILFVTPAVIAAQDGTMPQGEDFEIFMPLVTQNGGQQGGGSGEPPPEAGAPDDVGGVEQSPEPDGDIEPALDTTDSDEVIPAPEPESQPELPEPNDTLAVPAVEEKITPVQSFDVPPPPVTDSSLDDGVEWISVEGEDEVSAAGLDAVNAYDAPGNWTVGGRLGVGIQNPAVKADIRQNTNGPAWIYMRNLHTGTSASVRLRFLTDGGYAQIVKHSGNATNFWSGVPLRGSLRILTESSARALILHTVSNNPVVFGTTNAERMRIQGNGRVGIGVTNPTHQLTILRSNSGKVLSLLGPDGGTLQYGARLNFGDENFVYLDEDLDDRLTIYARLRTAITGGNVGIGTITPDTKLHVVGNRIRLQNGAKKLDLRTDGSEVDIQTVTNDLFIRATGGSNHIMMNPFGQDGIVYVGNGGTGSELDVRGGIRTNGVTPVLIKRFSNIGNNAYVDTFISANNYYCVATGWSAKWDIQENDMGASHVWTYVPSGMSTWHLRVNFWSHNHDESPDVDVLCFRKEIATWSGAATSLFHPDED